MSSVIIDWGKKFQSFVAKIKLLNTKQGELRFYFHSCRLMFRSTTPCRILVPYKFFFFTINKCTYYAFSMCVRVCMYLFLFLVAIIKKFVALFNCLCGVHMIICDCAGCNSASDGHFHMVTYESICCI